jgi:molybdate transport system ATP-binding protein
MKLEVSLRRQLPDFDFEAEFTVEGARVGIFGPSGSGKSTLVSMLAGLVPPDRGRVRLDGDTLFDSARGIDLPPERRRIGVVFQQAHLFPHLNVRRNLFYGHDRVPAAERRIDPDTLIEVLGLGNLLERGVSALSGGERQRVALGRTVLSNPRLILLDEPLTGLDEQLKYQIVPHLREVFDRFDIPLMFISHSLEEMQMLTDRVLEFDQGRLCAQTTTADLARRHMATGENGYVNLLSAERTGERDGVTTYRWGDQEIFVTDGADTAVSTFELESKDITLFERRPEATSARNTLQCQVRELFGAGNRVGVDLACGDERLVVQITRDSARELRLAPGHPIVAVFKASALRRLW